jgi:hypothetical protein
MDAHEEAVYNINKASPSLCFFLSCLKYLKIEAKLVQIPVLKCWEPNSLGKAKILVTWLAQSMIEWGGFNAAPPGTSRDVYSGFDAARTQVLSTNPSSEKRYRNVTRKEVNRTTGEMGKA